MIATLALAVSTLAAQTAQSTIAQRRENQQARVGQGVASGQLTAKETARIEGQQARMRREVRQDRRANGGNLTNNQKAQVARQQNRLSRNIYNQKHDAQTQPR